MGLFGEARAARWRASPRHCRRGTMTVTSGPPPAGAAAGRAGCRASSGARRVAPGERAQAEAPENRVDRRERARASSSGCRRRGPARRRRRSRGRGRPAARAPRRPGRSAAENSASSMNWRRSRASAGWRRGRRGPAPAPPRARAACQRASASAAAAAARGGAAGSASRASSPARAGREKPPQSRSSSAATGPAPSSGQDAGAQPVLDAGAGRGRGSGAGRAGIGGFQGAELHGRGGSGKAARPATRPVRGAPQCPPRTCRRNSACISASISGSGFDRSGAAGRLDDPDRRIAVQHAELAVHLDAPEHRPLALAVGVEADVVVVQPPEQPAQHAAAVEELVPPAVEGAVGAQRVDDLVGLRLGKSVVRAHHPFEPRGGQPDVAADLAARVRRSGRNRTASSQLQVLEEVLGVDVLEQVAPAPGLHGVHRLVEALERAQVGVPPAGTQVLGAAADLQVPDPVRRLRRAAPGS